MGIGGEEGAIAWSPVSNYVSKRDRRFCIFDAHRFLRCHHRLLLCNNNNARPQRRLIPPSARYPLARLRVLPPIKNPRSDLYDINEKLYALYFPFVTVTDGHSYDSELNHQSTQNQMFFFACVMSRFESIPRDPLE